MVTRGGRGTIAYKPSRDCLRQQSWRAGRPIPQVCRGGLKWGAGSVPSVNFLAGGGSGSKEYKVQAVGPSVHRLVLSSDQVTDSLSLSQLPPDTCHLPSADCQDCLPKPLILKRAILSAAFVVARNAVPSDVDPSSSLQLNLNLQADARLWFAAPATCHALHYLYSGTQYWQYLLCCRRLPMYLSCSGSQH